MSTRVPGVGVPVGFSPMSRLRIRVSDVDRAADYFGRLFGWKFEREQLVTHAEQKLVPARTVIPGPLGAVFSDNLQEPPVRLEFEVQDVGSAIALVHRLGGTGDAAAASDDQGVPLALSDRRDRVEHDHRYASQIGVVIIDVPDTARACGFHAGLFRRTFHVVGSG